MSAALREPDYGSNDFFMKETCLSAKGLKQTALLDTIKTYSDGTCDIHLKQWKMRKVQTR